MRMIKYRGKSAEREGNSRSVELLPSIDSSSHNERKNRVALRRFRTSRTKVLYFAFLLAFIALLYVATQPLMTGIDLFLLPPKKTCVITISAMNNFGFVHNLYDSVMTNSPNIDCFVWFMGDISEPTNLEAQRGLREIRSTIEGKRGFSMVTMNEIANKVDNFEPIKIAFMFGLVELQTTIKPFAFQYAFQEIGAGSAIYLDNDIWVTGSLGGIQQELRRRSAVVTPHISSPLPEDGKKQRDIDFLQTGVFNFGFVAFSNTAASVKFIRWWGERLNRYGFVNVKKAMFYDQNWGMFIPAFFDHEDYYVIRDLRYNIAYWNLHETGAGLHMKNGLPHLENPITKKAEQAVFIHFSGMSLLEKYDIEHISQHQTRFTLHDFPRIKEVWLAYMDLVVSHDTIRYRSLPYGYDCFTDGTEIEPWMKEVYAAAVLPVDSSNFVELGESVYDVSLSPFLQSSFQKNVIHDPFCASKDCHLDASRLTFLQWLLRTTPGRAVDMDGSFYFSGFEEHAWESRPDVQAVFPDPTGAQYSTFKTWFQQHAVSDGFMVKKAFKQWKRTWKYHSKNHLKFHKLSNSTKDLGLNIYGWHAGLFSIGISARKIFHSAKLVNLSVNAIEASMVPARQFHLTAEVDNVLTRSCSKPVNLVIMNADSTWIFKKDFPRVIREKKYNIGYWAWELDVFPRGWMEHLTDYDEIWCPSSFIKKSIEESEGYDGTVVKVLPIPSEPASTRGTEKKQPAALALPMAVKKHVSRNSAKPFVFLVVFDYYSFEERKNPAAAIRAFLDAFPAGEDRDKKYQLIVKTHSGTGVQISKLVKVAEGDTRVLFINTLLSEKENDALHEYQDCYVSLHRSEGYGMNILEALGNGVPVIATDYSGNVDFFRAMPSFEGECTFPIPYKLVELEESDGPYTKGNHWADVDHSHVVSAMRSVVHNDCKNKRGREMMTQVNAHFGPEAVGERMKALLHESFPRIVEKQKKPATALAPLWP